MKKATASIVTTIFAIVAALNLFAAASASPHQPCTVEQGQRDINEGRYEQAIRVFTCLIENNPTEVEGYRGRIEAELLLGRYSDALADHARVTAKVLPAHLEAEATILAGYAERLASAPDDIPALVGASFTHWADYEYLPAIQVLNHLLEVNPQHPFGNLFRGSSRLLKGVTRDKGVADLERGLALQPENVHARFIVADAYTYGLPDPERAFAEASLALAGGLNTPRVHAILATSYFAFGDTLAAATHLLRHFQLVTTELIPTPALGPNASLTVNLVPGRAYEIPVPVTAGSTVSIVTSSRDYWDSIAVLLAPDGTPVTGSDDANAYFAAFDWIAPATGTYRLRVTFFESVNFGNLTVTRK
jgi:tetratricopeptide (TPR) repeat protein